MGLLKGGAAVRAFAALAMLSALPPAARAQGSVQDTSQARYGEAPADSLARDTAQALELQEKSVKIPGSKVHREKEVSRIRLSRSDLQKVAAAQGDPLKVLGTLPGVVNQNDLSVRPFVRGGKAEETQILWDGVTLLQPYHFGTLYSIFNTESLDDMTLYTGGFPVEAGDALSAAILMRSRPAPLDSFCLFADLSLLRGSAYVGVPLIPGRLAASVSWQAFWYDWVIDRAWDVADLVQGDSAFAADKRQFRSLVEMPNFRDLQFGLDWKVTPRVDADYVGLLSRDGFHARDSKTRYYRDGREVSPNWFNAHSEDGPVGAWTAHQGLDTAANVAVDNAIHALHFRWRPTENLDVAQRLAYQRQEWHVQFSDEVAWHDSLAPDGRYAGYKTFAPSVQRLALEKQAFDWNLEAQWQWSPRNLARLGTSQSVRSFDYDTHLPRALYETIVNGSVDVTDGFGYLDPNGTVIRENDPGVYGDADFITSLPNLLRFDYAGHQRGNLVSAYGSDAWSLDDRHRLTLGLRAEMDTWSGGASLSPRLAWFQGLGKRDELTLASGLYTQADLPFNQRDADPSLRPEKAFHFNAEWSHHFSDHYRMEVQAYQKNYYDLVVPVLHNTGRIDWRSDLAWGIDSAAFESLDPSVKQAILDRIGEKDVGYVNGGVGKAGGCEISFFYDPNPVWSGWVSAEVAYSKRRDFEDEPVYDFRYGRPWAYNWVNYFHMPSNYELSLRARWAAGLPYSEYRFPGMQGGTPMGDTVFYLSPRNKARYAPYSRWDLRLTKDFRSFGHPMQFYTEVWNMFNAPNFVMRDERSGLWKFFDANYPIPVLFLGLNFRW